MISVSSTKGTNMMFMTHATIKRPIVHSVAFVVIYLFIFLLLFGLV